MKPPLGLALAASTIGTAHAAAVTKRGTSSSQDLCAGKSFEEAGNWYCQPVQHIMYQNVDVSGHYNEVTMMDQKTGACEMEPRKFSGPLAPFNEPVSPSLSWELAESKQ